MSQKPPGVMLYPQDLLPLVGHLPQDAAGRLLMAILNYSAFSVVPPMDGPEQWVWPAVKDRIDRDREAYSEKCARNKENGKRGGRPRKNQEEEPGDEPEETEENPEKPDGFFGNRAEPDETEENRGEAEKANNNSNPNNNSNTNWYPSPQRAGARGGERNVEKPVENPMDRITELRERFFSRVAERYRKLGIKFTGFETVRGLYRFRMRDISQEDELSILEAMEDEGYDQIPDPVEWMGTMAGVRLAVVPKEGVKQ